MTATAFPADRLHKFLDEFVAVLAVCPLPEEGEYWSVPLHKSLLTPINRTILHPDKLWDYSLAPKKDGKIAFFSIIYDYRILPIWATNYYVSQFGVEMSMSSTMDLTI